MSITDGTAGRGAPPAVEGILDAIREGAGRIDAALCEAGYEQARATPLQIAADEVLEAIGESAGLEVGMVVAIYQRPLTREEFEGHAELVAKAPGETDEGLQRWAVRFVGENETFWRTIPADEGDRRTPRQGQ